jgi:hypothetical protein
MSSWEPAREPVTVVGDGPGLLQRLKAVFGKDQEDDIVKQVMSNNQFDVNKFNAFYAKKREERRRAAEQKEKARLQAMAEDAPKKDPAPAGQEHSASYAVDARTMTLGEAVADYNRTMGQTLLDAFLGRRWLRSERLLYLGLTLVWMACLGYVLVWAFEVWDLEKIEKANT